MDRTTPFRWIKDCAIWLSDPYREQDRRQSVRLPAELKAAISLGVRTMEGRSVNLSRGGAAVLVPEAIPCGSEVFVRFPEINRSGLGEVLRCFAQGDEYELAMQFRNGLGVDDRNLAGFDCDRAKSAGAWDAKENDE